MNGVGNVPLELFGTVLDVDVLAYEAYIRHFAHNIPVIKVLKSRDSFSTN
jgi:hypothetical protein